MWLRSVYHASFGLFVGPIWFTLQVLLWSLGLGLAAVLVGLPLLWLALVAGAWMARVEADLANNLLGTSVTAPAAPRGWRGAHTALLDAQLFLLARFALGPPTFLLALLPGDAYARLWTGLAERLLHPETGAAGQPLEVPLRLTASAAGAVTGTCVLIYALTDFGGYLWPVWPALGLGAAVGLHATNGLRRAGKAVIVVLCLGVWAAAGGGYFWPVWPALGILVSEVVHQLVRAGARSQQPRVAALTRTRAEVVGAQEDELRRIERDLHDGAQARLVSLAMSLGLAESRLDEDPGRARELMAEAQDQARTALRELRDLARGIAPPVLQDRGLKAAIEALAATVPIPVTVTGSDERAPAAVERAGYFVAAEALANAVKHAGAHEIAVTVLNSGLDLEVEVADDGRGGADPAGSGLAGLRRRVEAVDGRLLVDSSADRGTIIRASLPCASS